MASAQLSTDGEGGGSVCGRGLQEVGARELERPAEGLREEGELGEVAPWAGGLQSGPCTVRQEEGLQPARMTGKGWTPRSLSWTLL